MSLLIDRADYAVVDLETTGLSPKYHHRVIEVGVVRLSPRGRVVGEYVTLVNPGRDLGPTSIHGITGIDVQDAPTFRDISGDLLDILKGAIFTGHNVRFDLMFLDAEYERIGYGLPDLPSLCTLHLGSLLGFGDAGYRLIDCCERVGIPKEAAHTALGDARAAASLASALLDMAIVKGHDSLDDVGCNLPIPSRSSWPILQRTGLVRTRQETAGHLNTQASYMARLLERLHVGRGEPLDPDEGGYLDALERVLEDRLITDEEGEELMSVASDFELTRSQVQRAHSRYVEALVDAAMKDEAITQAERRDLVQVTHVLGFSEAELDEMIQKSKGDTRKPVSKAANTESLVGKSVCFTGALTSEYMGSPITRELAHELASQAGLIPNEGVSKDLDILVVADPHSLSRKARKARGYGTRILAERPFWKMIGVDVE